MFTGVVVGDCAVIVVHMFQTGTVDIPGLAGMGADYYPYVFYKINLDLVEMTKR